MIGITTPGGYYVAFADNYLDYISGFRSLLLHSSKLLLQAIGYDVYLKDGYTIKMVNGRGVQLVYSCLGYGVISFWIAFVFANKTSLRKMLQWMMGGVVVICLLNVVRISLMLISVNKHWPSLFNLDNHTWFNIVLYGVLFFMIYLFDQTQQSRTPKTKTNQYVLGNKKT
jgi:exosortase/archaeosortase family protein